MKGAREAPIPLPAQLIYHISQKANTDPENKLPE